MEGAARNPLSLEPTQRHAAAVSHREQIAGRTVAVPPLDERRPGAELRHERAGGRLGALLGGGITLRQGRGLLEIGGDERGAPDQRLEGAPGAPLEQRGSIARRQDRIDHDRNAGRCGQKWSERELHVANHVVGGERTDLDRVRSQIPQQHAELFEHDGGKGGQHLMDFRGVLNGDRGDHAGPVNPHRAKDLEICLKAGSSGGIRSRDAECDLHRRPW